MRRNFFGIGCLFEPIRQVEEPISVPPRQQFILPDKVIEVEGFGYKITNSLAKLVPFSRKSAKKYNFLCIHFSKIWKLSKKCLSLQRQNVVRGRERFAFRAKFKLDLSDYHMRT